MISPYLACIYTGYAIVLLFLILIVSLKITSTFFNQKFIQYQGNSQGSQLQTEEDKAMNSNNPMEFMRHMDPVSSEKIEIRTPTNNNHVLSEIKESSIKLESPQFEL